MDYRYTLAALAATAEAKDTEDDISTDDMVEDAPTDDGGAPEEKKKDGDTTPPDDGGEGTPDGTGDADGTATPPEDGGGGGGDDGDTSNTDGEEEQNPITDPDVLPEDRVTPEEVGLSVDAVMNNMLVAREVKETSGVDPTNQVLNTGE